MQLRGRSHGDGGFGWCNCGDGGFNQIRGAGKHTGAPINQPRRTLYFSPASDFPPLTSNVSQGDGDFDSLLLNYTVG